VVHADLTSPWSGYTGYWRYDLENQAAILARGMPKYYAWRQALEKYDWEPPEEIDPRPWLRIASQGNIGSCFPEGVLVTLADGQEKPIEEMRVGDDVLTIFGLKRSVTATMSRRYRGDLLTLLFRKSVTAKKELTLTTDHKVWVPHSTGGRFVSAEELRVGDPVWLYEGEGTVPLVTEVDKITSNTVDQTVYDIEVETDHCFWANEVAVHNCQGTAIADCTEYAYYLKYGPDIQLSWFYAYVTSQEEDNISGDQGSTLDGGGRAASRRGICLESSFPYPSGYSSGLSFYRSNKAKLDAEAASYKLKGEVPIASWKDALNFLQSRSGAIQTGLMWGSSMDRGFEIESYSPGSGGHSTAFVGYLKRQGWEDGVGLLMRNSWGLSWGKGGYAIVRKTAFDQMLKGQWNLFVGRSEAESPVPQVVPDI